jgi:hypothetical protein
MDNNTNANPFTIGNDENERLALEECAKRQRIDQRVAVLVFPAGHCSLPVKFARLGATVTVGDAATMRRDTEGRILAAGLRDDITFTTFDLDDLPADPPGKPYDIIVLRRGLCSMPYDQARSVVRQLMFKLKIGGKLYISILGLHSELGEGYPCSELPIDQRFAPLAPALAKKYGIERPVCLYTERNLFMLLLEAGASVLRTLTTTYGNVKGVAVRV